MPRTRLSLDGQWHFWIDPVTSLSPVSLNDQLAAPITVPAPWQSQSVAWRNYTGVAWYRRTIDLPADWFADQRVIVLGFGAVDYVAEVWLNDTQIGAHEGGYLPFEFDVTSAARPGENILTVRVTDSLELFPEIPHGKQSWYGPLSGLWQSVWIESRVATHLLAARVTPHGDQVEIAVTLNRDLAADQTLIYEIHAPDGQVCARSVSNATTITLPVEQPLLWDVDTPWLYTVWVTLSDSAPIDTVSTTIGFRTVEARNGQIWLNSRPVYLRGALDQDYYPDLICTPPSQDYLEQQFRQAKDMGLNCLRVHIKIADPRYYAAADRVGLLIWTELPNWIDLTADTQRRARETLQGMVERDGHHPSIIIWTIINESWGVDLSNPEHRAWLADTYDYLKALDPTRLVVGNSACWGNFHVVTDLEDFHNYYAMPDHYPQWRAWIENFASRPAWTYAHAYDSAPTWRDFMREPWAARSLTPAPEVRRRGDEPLIVSEFGNWGLPDVQQLRAHYHGDPWWFETGLEWGDGVVYPHGVDDRFTAFHFNRAFPTLSDLAVAAQRLQFAALKYEIEQIRTQPSLSGYVITEFTDVHWECNGLLDMCRNPKVFYNEIQDLNSADVIIPTWQRLAYWAGERGTIDLALSHFSAIDLRGCRLEWQIAQQRGTLHDLHPQPAGVTTLGTITFDVPPVDRGTRTRLELRLVRSDGAETARTYQEIYIFPRSTLIPTARLYAPTLTAALRALGYATVTTSEQADLVVAEVMTDELRHYVLNGGRVLWLAESIEAWQTHLGNFQIEARQGRAWQGDWASSLSWLNRDVMFGDIPTDGLLDFAFADLTPECVITGLKPHDFACDVHAGLCVGWLHKVVALIVERRLGRGHLLISTLRLSNALTTNPMAASLLHAMLAHLRQRS